MAPPNDDDEQDAPNTPDFTKQQQGYFEALGFDRISAFGVGSDGAGIKVADIEYSWTPGHEDLQLEGKATVINKPNAAWDKWHDHGTAVWGELVGVRGNGYGIKGLIPAASAILAHPSSRLGSYCVACGITEAAKTMGPGDVILIEQQASVAGQLVPVEFHQAEFDAIHAATAKGIVVVEAGANDRANLDDATKFGNKFDRSVRDSGAIVVGGGHPEYRMWAGSSYGSRLDVHAWYSGIFTSGYGDVSGAGDRQREYTAVFGGTSGASPMVTAAVAALQGVNKATNGMYLAPADVREILTSTGTPQPEVDAKLHKIGPLPNIRKALERIAPNVVKPPPSAPPADPSCTDDTQVCPSYIAHCAKSWFKDFGYVHCKKTCGLCG